MILAVALAGQLAASCAPSVAPGTLASIAGTESEFNTLAIHDNTDRMSYAPVARLAAIALADRLITAGHSVDLGLMQINSANLVRLGLTVRTAFDPCDSLAAAARLLVTDYRLAPGGRSGVRQSALQAALSRYNTGNGWYGFQNGYVQRVVATARRVVPEINPAIPVAAPKNPAPAPKSRAAGSSSASNSDAQVTQSAPPSWDVFPRSTGPARLARRQAVTITAHRVPPPQPVHPGKPHEDTHTISD